MTHKFNFLQEFGLVGRIEKTPKKWYTNNIHRYPAKMVKFIPQAVLPIYTNEGDTVLDPFCGSGTVLMEAKLLGRNAIGIDINPLSVLISRVKSETYNPENLRKSFSKLMASIKKFNKNPRIPDFPNRDYWFEKDVQTELYKILQCIENVKNRKYRNFFLVCFSSIIRKVSNADPEILPPVKTKMMKEILKYRKIEVVKLFENTVVKNIENAAKFSQDCNKECLIKTFKGDARKLNVEDESVDVVVTSPPYVSAQKYARSMQLEMYWLGLADQEKFRKIDYETIGSERIKLMGLENSLLTDNELANKFINKILKKDKRRAFILSKYVNDMKFSISEIHRVLKSGKYFILVIGNSSIRGYSIPTNDIMKELAEKNGFVLENQYRDKIRYRGFTQKRNKTAGIINNEWIMVFRKSNSI